MTDFRGAALPLSQAGLDAACRLLDVTPVEIWAVLSVETVGCGFLPDGRPQILFERHVFSDRTGGRFDRDDPTISSNRPGGYGSPGGYQYDRLLRAMRLDRTAALESASWGIGQVMGYHAAMVALGTVETLVAQAMHSEDDQLMHMARFIKAGRLDDALRRHDWAAFARGYNGPGYAKHNYDGRLRQQHARWSAGPLPDLQVRSRQIELVRAGYSVGPIDGILGRRTEAAWADYSGGRVA